MTKGSSNRSIGIFDSGFGGLTVMRAIIDLLPQENIVYLGDTAHLPYGEKSPEAIRSFSLTYSNFLVEQNIKLLVIACHTACTVAFDLIQECLPIPVVGVIEPAIAHLETVVQHGDIVILGTRRTIESKVYQKKIKQRMPSNHLIAVACPLFVPLIEEGWHEHKLAELAVLEYLGHLQGKTIDAVLLACTHYPLLKSLLEKNLVGEKTIAFIDPAMSCAQSIKKVLTEKVLLNSSTVHPSYKFFVTDDPDKFQKLGKNFLQISIPQVELLDENIYINTYTRIF